MVFIMITISMNMKIQHVYQKKRKKKENKGIEKKNVSSRSSQSELFWSSSQVSMCSINLGCTYSPFLQKMWICCLLSWHQFHHNICSVSLDFLKKEPRFLSVHSGHTNSPYSNLTWLPVMRSYLSRVNIFTIQL